MSVGGKVHSPAAPAYMATQAQAAQAQTAKAPLPRNTVMYELSIAVNEGWMTRDAARVVPDLIRQTVAELKAKLMLIAAENAVTVSATFTSGLGAIRPFDLSGPDPDVR